MKITELKNNDLLVLTFQPEPDVFPNLHAPAGIPVKAHPGHIEGDWNLEGLEGGTWTVIGLTGEIVETDDLFISRGEVVGRIDADLSRT